MTSGEMKFALVVESVLNSVPEPEYRQMLVEALCVVSMVVENQVTNITLYDKAIKTLILFIFQEIVILNASLHFNRSLHLSMIL